MVWTVRPTVANCLRDKLFESLVVVMVAFKVHKRNSFLQFFHNKCPFLCKHTDSYIVCITYWYGRLWKPSRGKLSALCVSHVPWIKGPFRLFARFKCLSFEFQGCFDSFLDVLWNDIIWCHLISLWFTFLCGFNLLGKVGLESAETKDVVGSINKSIQLVLYPKKAASLAGRIPVVVLEL